MHKRTNFLVQFTYLVKKIRTWTAFWYERT